MALMSMKLSPDRMVNSTPPKKNQPIKTPQTPCPKAIYSASQPIFHRNLSAPCSLSTETSEIRFDRCKYFTATLFNVYAPVMITVICMPGRLLSVAPCSPQRVAVPQPQPVAQPQRHTGRLLGQDRPPRGKGFGGGRGW